MSRSKPSPRSLRRRQFRLASTHLDPVLALAGDIASAAVHASAPISAATRTAEMAAARAELAELAELEADLVVVSGPLHWGLVRTQEGGEPAAAWGQAQHSEARTRADEAGAAQDAAFAAALAASVDGLVTVAGRTRTRRRKAALALRAYPYALSPLSLVYQAFAQAPF